MDKKIIYLVVGEDNNDKEKTLKSLELVTRKGDIVLSTFYKKGEQALEAKLINQAVAGITKKVDEYYICLIPVGGEISGGKEGLDKVIFPYINKGDNDIYVPLVEQYEMVDDKPSFRGFFNATLWNSHQTDERGYLNHSTAIKQMDCTLYFCLIPVTLLKATPFNEEITYFHQYEWLNNLTKQYEEGEEEEGTPRVKGICKLIGSYKETEQYKEESLEIKRELFKKAQTPYLNEAKTA